MGRVALKHATAALLATASAVVGLDQITKALARSALDGGGPIGQLPYVGRSVVVVPHVFSFTLVRNMGGAFGFFSGHPGAFAAMSSLIVLAIAVYWWWRRPTTWLLAVSLGLIVGGSVGNLIDRVLVGRVTDFLDFRIWPVFNVADASVVVGVGVLVAWVILAPENAGRSDTDAAREGEDV